MQTTAGPKAECFWPEVKHGQLFQPIQMW